MTRLTSIAVFAASVVLGGTAFAQSQAEIAARLNEEGKAFMYQDKWAEASAKFRDAVARVPEAKYFYNLCASLYKEGKFGEALTACNAAGSSDTASPQLKEQSARLAQGIKEEAQKQGVAVEPQGGGQSPGEDPNLCANNPSDPRCAKPDICTTNPQAPECQQTAPQPQPQFAVGRPPTQDILAATTPDNKYTWTLGFELYGGGGRVGQKDVYGTAATGFRIKGDYLLNSVSRVGAQGYFQFTHFGKGDEQMGFEPLKLDIIDFGVAVYKHVCVGERLCLTPLAGFHIAMMSPAGAEDGVGSRVFEYAAAGGRVEAGLHYAFGSRMEHVLGVALGANLYTSVFSGPSDEDVDNPTIEMVGLDKGGAAGYLSLGYTYRFNTPLGSGPFVTLQ